MTKKGIIMCLVVAGCVPSDGDGERIVYFPGTDVVKQSVQMKEGKKHGALKNFYRNGRPEVIQHFRNDTLHDTTLYYNRDGVLREIQVFDGGRMTGTWKKFNKKGELYWKMSFADNQREGEAVQYTYNSLKLLKRHFFRNGEMHGRQEQYHNNGKPRSVSFYDHGNPLDGTQEWTETGKEIRHRVKFRVEEKDEVLFTGTLTYYISLSDPAPEDEMYVFAFREDNGRYYTTRRLERKGDRFELSFDVNKGTALMESVNLLAQRKTSYGNYIFATHTVNAAATNF